MKNLYIFTYVFCDTCRAPALRQYTGIACNVLFARINGRLVTFIVNDDFLENEGVKYFRDNKNKILKLGKLPFSVTEGLIGEI